MVVEVLSASAFGVASIDEELIINTMLLSALFTVNRSISFDVQKPSELKETLQGLVSAQIYLAQRYVVVFCVVNRTCQSQFMYMQDRKSRMCYT